VSTPYSASLAATGGTTPYNWAITSCSGSCNTGLGFNSAGVLFGTPANAGTSTFTFAVTDAKGQTASAALNITIAAASTTTPTTATPLAISSSTLPSGVVSTAYSTSLAATGGTTPYTWTITSCSGTCTTGLSLSQAGVLSGTPASSGASTYTVGVTDATGQTASATLSLTIAAAATTSSNANYFVSPTGSDSNPCSQASPCATPDHAFNLASPGQTVQVAAGTYDYGSGAAGALLRQTNTQVQWQANGSYLTANLLNLPASVAVLDGGAHQVAQTTFGYDENNGSPQGIFGNQTSVTRWLNVGASPKNANYLQHAGHAYQSD